MAQHDGIIDNAAGAAFRTDINNAIAALISNNSGSSAPSTTYAYMFWADTSSGLLKQRNAANNAWITIGTLADANLGLLPKAGGALTGLLQLEQGADIASGSTIDLGAATGNNVTITHSTGTTAITSFGGTSSLQKGTIIDITFSISGGALSLTYNAISMIIPGLDDLALSNGDKIRVKKTSDSNAYWEIINVTKMSGLPVVSELPGFIKAFGGPTAPVGYLDCDGSAISRTTYAALFDAIGESWGIGDGSTTFNLPNIPAGETLLGGGTVGGSTTGQVQSHTHGVQQGLSATSVGGTVQGAGSGGGIQTGGPSTGVSTKNLAAGRYVLWVIKY